MEPKIDESWSNDDSMSLRPFLVVGIPILLVALAVVLSCFKGCNELGRQGKKDFYDPVASPDSGFVGSANRLLAELLTDTLATDSPIVDLASLNKKYRALTFALPYDQQGKAVIDASDLRLVGINAERIRSEKSRVFYFNSRLPQLLQRQSSNLTQAYFRIRSHGETYDVKSNRKPITIKSIEVVSSMFKVALVKDPWTGVIVGEESPLFDQSAVAYITFGNTMLPIPNADGPETNNNCIFRAVADRCAFLTPENKSIDYYDIYRKMFSPSGEKHHAYNIELYNTPRDYTHRSFSLCVSDNKLYISSNSYIQVLGTSSMQPFEKATSGRSFVPLEDGLKIVVFDSKGEGANAKGKSKLGEFTVYTKNPTRTLSNLILTNVGKQRYNIAKEQTDLFTQQVIRGLSSNLSNSYNIDTVHISLDPVLSLEFERELKSYLHQIKSSMGDHSWQDRELYDISMTVMDMATGDIIATPYYTTLFDQPDYSDTLKMTTRNPALTRRYIGSTFKPMVALAAAQTNPKLLNLDTRGKYSADVTPGKTTKANFFGRTTYAWAKKAPRHWAGTTFPAFLAYSDDIYPVALAALAMTGKNIGNECRTLPVDEPSNFFTMKKGVLHFKDENTDKECPKTYDQPFIHWLSYLYDANTITDYTSDTLLFKHLYLQCEAAYKKSHKGEEAPINFHFGLDELSPDVTNLRMDRFTSGDDFRARLQPWILGQGDNQWSTIKLAEAWCRMLTKRNVTASMIKSQPVLESLTANKGELYSVKGSTLSSSEINSTWNSFLSMFHQAQNYSGEGMNGSSTLLPMYNAVHNLDPDLVLFSKTGTPDAYARYDIPLLGGNKRFLDLGMFTFGIMSNSQYNIVKSDDTTRPVHGLVCVIRITRSYECKACSHRSTQCTRCEHFNGLSSSHARNFFSANPERLKKFYEMSKGKFKS